MTSPVVPFQAVPGVINRFYLGEGSPVFCKGEPESKVMYRHWKIQSWELSELGGEMI